MSKVSKAEKKAAKMAAKQEKKLTKAKAKADAIKVKEIKSYNKLVKKGKVEAKKPTVDFY